MRCVGRIFQIIAFMGEMPHVPVHGVWIFLCSLFFIGLLFIILVDRHAMGFCVSHFIFTGLHIPDTPWSDDLHVRSQRFDGEFETNLVIAFAGRAVADGISAIFLCHVDEAFADQRTCKGGTEQVLAFITAICLKDFVCIFFNKFFANIQSFCIFSTGCERLLVDGIEVFRLSQVHGAGNDFAAIVFFQPRNNNGGIETTGICKNYFLYAFNICHDNAAFPI